MSVAGRVDVRERAIRKVSEKVASEVIGVEIGRVSVAASDYRDGVAVRIDTPMPVPSLDDSDAVTAAGAVVDAAGRMQARVKDELSRVLGRPVTRVDITISGAVTPTKRRVR